MRIEPFALERYQSVWENRVRYNLAESGVLPLQLDELLDGTDADILLRQRLHYNQTNGSEELRAAIAALHPGATAANVLVCNGAAEANHLVLWRLVEPGDDVVAVLPNYMQTAGLAAGYGARLRTVWLREEEGWSLDPGDVESAVGARTRLVIVCNPNNPTGAVLSDEARKALVGACERNGAWLLADEVYRGAERDGVETPTFFGAHAQVLVTGGLSKAYGLPGLRIGWVVGPAAIVAELWARRDYVSIAPATLSDVLGRRALLPPLRARFLARTRALLSAGDAVFERWRAGLGDALAYVPPRAGAIAFPRYTWRIGSTLLAERLRTEQDVLVVPGDHFEIDHHLRLNVGLPAAELAEALARAAVLLQALD